MKREEKDENLDGNDWKIGKLVSWTMDPGPSLDDLAGRRSGEPNREMS